MIAVNDKSKGGHSRFEIYSFRQTGLIQDQYRLKNSDSMSSMGNSGSRQSVVEILTSPQNVGRRNTFFRDIPDTKEIRNVLEVRLAQS